MIDDVIYVLHDNPYLGIESLPESYYKGRILSTVSLSEIPTMNGEANFNVEVGMPYAGYGNGYIVLWNDVWTLFVTRNDLVEGVKPTPRIVGGTPEKAPVLEVALINDNSSEQRVETLQLTTSWSVNYEDGTSTGYEADSPHPLQLQQTSFAEATLYITNLSAEIVLQFSDDYPPQTVTVQRWLSEYAYGSQNIQEHLGNSERITLSGSSIHVDDDGHNYIYEICATWINGKSWYSFRVFTGRQSLTADNEITFPKSELLRTGEFLTLEQIETLKTEALYWQSKVFGMGGFAIIIAIDPPDGSGQQVYISIDRSEEFLYGCIYEKMQLQPPDGVEGRLIQAQNGGGSGELDVTFIFVTEDSEWFELFYIYAGDLSEDTKMWETDGKWLNITESQPGYIKSVMEMPIYEMLLQWEHS